MGRTDDGVPRSGESSTDGATGSRPRRTAARDRAVGILREALTDGGVRVCRSGGSTSVTFDGATHLILSPTSCTNPNLRRHLRALYEAKATAQPSDEALRAMLDALRTAADELPPSLADAASSESHGEAVFASAPPQSQADLAVALADEAGVELWHTPAGEAYATTAKDGARDHRRVSSADFKRWLQALFFQTHSKAIRRESLSDAMGVLEGRALLGPEHEVHVRVAGHGECVYIDLADRERHVVVISRSGWRVTQDVPVRFRRPSGSLPLPIPTRGGSIDELRPLINVADDDGWVLLVGFLVAALHPSCPYFVLVLVGEQGTAKSTATRLVVCLLDPKDSPVRRPPRDERDLAIAARHGRIVAFNNLSHLSDALSDALSSLATEGGFVTRSLFTDDDETRFRERRPIVANGIPDFVTRGDLADRSIKLVLQRITKRRDEADVLAEFERVRPGVLGALCDAVSAALRDRAHVILHDPPRMADATRWITAAETAFGWPQGRFLAAYRRCVATTYGAVLEADPVAEALLSFASTSGWRGSAGDLFKVLRCPGGESPGTARDRGWPRSPHGMAGAIRRLAPALRRAGVEVTDLGTDRSRRVQVWNIARVADGGSAVGHEGSQASEGSNEAEPVPAGPTAREPSPEPSLFTKARPGNPGETEVPDLASLASLPVPALRRAHEEGDDTWRCEGCGARVSDGHECPGGES